MKKSIKIECAINESIKNLIHVDYNAEFVPQNLSRNSENKDPSINWRITISKGKKVLSTDYMQGIGHAPFYRHSIGRQTVHDHSINSRIIYLASNEGKTTKRDPFKTPFEYIQKLPTPDLSDVMYSLQIDSDVLDY